jgi:hypothetical protein
VRHGFRRTTALRVGVGLVAAGLALTACSGGDPGSAEPDDEDGARSEATEDPPSEAERFAEQSPAEIQRAALATMRATSSLRLSGTITDGGERLSLDVRVAPSGDCTGTVGQGGGTSEFTQVGDRGWIRPDAAFWRAVAGPRADQIIQRVGDEWVTVPPDGGSFDDICDVDPLLDELEEDGGEVSVGDLDEVGGRAAVPLTVGGDDPGTLWVAADEPHHLLLVESDAEDEPGRLRFRGFDTELTVTAPPKDRVVDLR